MGISMQAASARKIAVKVAGRSTSVRKPLSTPPMPIPRLTRAKLMPKNWVRSGPETMLEVRALKPGHPMPKLMPIRVNAATKAGTEVAKARITAPTSWARLPQINMTREPRRSIRAPTGPVTTSATPAMRLISSPATSSSMPRTSCT